MTPYIISYFSVGLLFAIATTLHKNFAKEKFQIAFVSTVVLWPLLIFFAPEIFFPSYREESVTKLSKTELLTARLTSLAHAETSLLSSEEAIRLARITKDCCIGMATFSNTADFETILSSFWESNIPPAAYQALRHAVLDLEREYDRDNAIRFSIVAPDWYIGFSNEFVKSIANIDRKMQGRILEAISKIAAAPIDVHGDTIKPLTGNQKGLWRYRLGDARLLYYPDVELRNVVLISFASRGDIYNNMPNIATLTNRLRGSVLPHSGKVSD